MNNTTQLITDTDALISKLDSFGSDHKAAFDFLNEQKRLADLDGGFYMNPHTGSVDTRYNWWADLETKAEAEELVKVEFSFYEQSWYELDI